MRPYAHLSQSENPFHHPYYKKAFLFSMVLHLILLGSSIVLPMISLLRGKGVVTYSSTIRVDLIELPDQMISKMDQSILSTRDAIRELRKEAKMVPYKETLKFKAKNILLRERQKLALEELRGKEAKQIAEKREAQRKGNVISEGVIGEVTPGKKELEAYRSLLMEIIKLRWALPTYLKNQTNLIGEVILFLNADGTILRKQMSVSGNQEYDEYMLRSLEEALPFPEVPSELRKDVRYDGVSIVFRPGEIK